MNITDIAQLISEESTLSSKEISAVIMQFVDKAQELIYDGKEVKIRGLATFKIKIDKERKRKSFGNEDLKTEPKRFSLKVVRSPDFVKKINNKPIG